MYNVRLMRWRGILPLAAVGLLALGACGSGPGDANAVPDRAGGESQDPATPGTAIRVRIGETVLTGRLRDVPASRDLVAQLPLTLTFRDFNSVEKISKLPRELSMDSVPAGDDPEPRDIGYYAPSGDLVLYYGDVGYFPGIVRLGQFDGSVDVIQAQPGFTATVELAD